MKSTARLFNRHFVLLFFSLLALSFCHGMVCIELPLYLTDAGYGTTAAGYLTAAFAIVAMLSRVFGGHLTDRFPKTAVVAAGCVLYGLGCALFPVFSGVGFLLLCRMLNGAGFSAATTASYAACADVCPQERVGEGIAYFGMAQNIASAFSAMLLLAILERWGYPVSFRTSAAAGGAAALLALAARYRTKPAAPAEKKKFDPRDYFEKSALPVGLTMFIVNLGFGIVGMYVTLFAVGRGYVNPGLFFTISTVVMMVTKAAAGRAGERIPSMAIIVGCSLIGAVGMALIALVNNEMVFYFAGVLYGIGSGANISRLDAEVYRRAPASRRGAATGTYMFFSDLSFGASGLLWGSLMDVLPHETVFLICAAVLVASAFAAPALLRIGRPSENAAP